jgi:hypothetical protein
MADTAMNVTGIVSGGIANDLSSLRVSFGIQRGEPIVCEFRPDVLEGVVIKLSEMIQEFQNKTLSTHDHRLFAAAEVVEATASSPEGGGTVILTFRGNTAVLSHFALRPEMSSRLRLQMQAVEEIAKSEAAKTRQ